MTELDRLELGERVADALLWENVVGMWPSWRGWTTR